MRKKYQLLLPIMMGIVCMVLAETAWAATLYVDVANTSGTEDGSAEHPFNTVQEGIDGSQDGDTILIRPGVYFEHLVLNSRALTFQSTDGPTVTTIDGSDSGSIFTISGGTYVMTGLTLDHGNAGESWGGAINMAGERGGVISMDNCTIQNNRGAYSGGVVMFGRYAPARLSATNTRFLNNRAEQMYGPAVTALFYANFTCSGCRFEGNSAAGYAGAVYAAVGFATIRDSVFIGNSAGSYGGAVYAMGGGAAYLDRCVLIGNSSGSYGGAGYAEGGATRLTVVNSLLAKNTAVAAGGALGGNITVNYSTIANNTAPSGGGVYVPEGMSGSIEDTIVYFNSSSPVLQPDTAHYSNIEQGFPGTGNINADPLFTNAAANDFTLTAASPCINAANPASSQTVDLAGTPRPQGSGFDMGAYEFTYSFTGFFPPVDNVPAVNVVKAGQPIPVKFSLNGDQGLAIFSDGYPVTQLVDCATFQAAGPSEPAASKTGLTYDAAKDQYVYMWNTERAWTGTCRMLTVRLTNGTDHTALFRCK